MLVIVSVFHQENDIMRLQAGLRLEEGIAAVEGNAEVVLHRSIVGLTSWGSVDGAAVRYTSGGDCLLKGRERTVSSDRLTRW